MESPARTPSSGSEGREMSDDLWTMLHAERTAFVEYLATLPAEDWERPSLCEGWRVHDVVAHLVAGAKMTIPAFIFKLITAGFSVDRMTAKDLQNEAGASPAQLTATLK